METEQWTTRWVSQAPSVCRGVCTDTKVQTADGWKGIRVEMVLI